MEEVGVGQVCCSRAERCSVPHYWNVSTQLPIGRVLPTHPSGSLFSRTDHLRTCFTRPSLLASYSIAVFVVWLPWPLRLLQGSGSIIYSSLSLTSSLAHGKRSVFGE